MSKKLEFIERIKSDFTYKSDLSRDQGIALESIKTIFGEAREILNSEIKSVIEHRHNRRCDDHVFAAEHYLRKAERRANAAVANEWTEDFASEVANIAADPDAGNFFYPKTEEVSTTRQAQCHIVTRTFYRLAVSIAIEIPYGRNASVFATALEDARGEYLDAINEAWTEKAKS